ncbi:Type 1 glutamine amidotransferase-like domain-containing protein [Agromyces sp. MMS24-K17]|uniref:Type 1 glutamine amidotransferase-like domain-containing protein n=1 Tax=Agromyces sp. MMS24-K17 TaxID=3372850 RepID=UPI00375473CB
MAHVVATGAGKAMMERRADPTHGYILELTGKERPRVLFVGTATGDDTAYIVSFYSTYDSDRCAPHHLPLFHRAVDDLAGFVKGFDVIHVGGGNTANMLDVWKRQGLDEILRERWEDPASNVVFTGGSAGGICWFEGGTTDSYGPTLQVLPEGLGFLEGSFCPHYDAEDQRQPLFHRALLDGDLSTGYAVGNLQSLHFTNAGGAAPEFVTAISPVEDPLALRVEAVDGRIVETPLPAKVLASTGPIVKGPSS